MKKMISIVAGSVAIASLLTACGGSKLDGMTCEDLFSQSESQAKETLEILAKENGVKEESSSTVVQDFSNELREYCGFTSVEYGFLGNVEKEAGVENPTALLSEFKYEG